MKSRFTKVTTAVLMVCASLFFMGCPEPVADVAVTGVTLDQSTLTVVRGLTGSLTPTVAPADATNKTVTWTTSDAAVATVANGVVTGVAVGTATITVTTADGAKTATCTVTVTLPAPAELFSYTIGADTVLNMAPGSNTGCYEPMKQLGTRVEQYIAPLYYYGDANAYKAGDAGGIYFNYYAAAAEVGYVSTVKSYISVGTSGVTIEKTIDGTLQTYTLDSDVEDVTSEYPSIALVINAKADVGSAASLAILNTSNKVLAIQALTETAADYTFSVPANQAFRIANGGANGTNMFVYSIKGTESTDAAPVVPDGEPYVVSVAITGSAEVTLDSELTLVGKVTVKAGAASTMTWSSSDETIATVSDAGVVTPVAEGTVTIRATSTFDTSKYAEKEITVLPVPENPIEKTTWDFRTAAMSSVNIQGVTGTVTGVTTGSSSTVVMDVDATVTNGKLAYNASGYAQFNSGTKISLPVKAGTKVTVLAYPGQFKYTVAGTAAVADETVYTATADGTCEIVATGGAYLYCITVETELTKVTTNWDFTAWTGAAFSIQTTTGSVTGVTTGSDTAVVMDVDATTGKFAYNASGYAQFNTTTKLSIPVAVGSVLTVVAYPGQAKYTIAGTATTTDETVYTATTAGVCEIIATGEAYINSISLVTIQ